MGTPEHGLRQTLVRGELVRLAYRLGRRAASGVLTLNARAVRPEVFVLRRGAAICAGEIAQQTLISRLVRLAAEPSVAAAFDGIAAYPPGALHQISLTRWARAHLEAQLDAARAESLLRELADRRLTLRADLAPELLDDVDCRILAALEQPRRVGEILALARVPRFRLLAFLHFLRAVGAIEVECIAGRSAARAPIGTLDRRTAALQLLGLDELAGTDEIKRAYRRLARTLHPDLQPDADAERRRALEHRFAELTAAYEALM